MEWVQRHSHDLLGDSMDGVADAVHELRCAAMSLAGWVELLRRVGQQDEQRMAALSAMRRNLANIRRVLDGLDADQSSEHQRSAAS